MSMTKTTTQLAESRSAFGHDRRRWQHCRHDVVGHLSLLFCDCFVSEFAPTSIYAPPSCPSIRNAPLHYLRRPSCLRRKPSRRTRSGPRRCTPSKASWRAKFLCPPLTYPPQVTMILLTFPNLELSERTTSRERQQSSIRHRKTR